MNNILNFFLILITSFSMTACDIVQEDHSDNITKDSHITNSQNIEFTVDKINLSKSYQNLETNIEEVNSDKDKDDELQLHLSLGLIKSSGVNIQDIIYRDGELNFYIENSCNEDESQYVVPKINISIHNFNPKEEIKYNIINTNYENKKIKYGINDILSKITSNLDITTNDLPIVNLKDIDGQLIWDISYNNIFNNNFRDEDIKSPIMDLDILVDSHTGEFLDYNTNNISDFIDDGQILDYSNSNYIFYKKQDNNNKESLWLYDIINNKKDNIYNTENNIHNIHINDSLEYAYILEESKENNGSNSLFILDIDSYKTYKILLSEDINPSLVEWKNNDILYILDSKDKNTKLYEFDLVKDNIEFKVEFNKKFNCFKEMHGLYLLTSTDNGKENSEIFITKDFKDLKHTIKGYKPIFIDENKIGYLNYNEEKDINSFNIYNLDTKDIYDSLKLNIVNYFIIDDDNIGLIEKKNTDNIYTFYSYNIINKNLKNIKDIITENIYHNIAENILYINLNIPSVDEKDMIILSMDINELIPNKE